jgi:hypothetical protein
MCKLPGARQDMHGQPPRPCATCGGKTGFHRLGCPDHDTQIIGYDVSPEQFRKLVGAPPDANKPWSLEALKTLAPECARVVGAGPSEAEALASYRLLLHGMLDGYEKMVRAVGATGGPADALELEQVAETMLRLGTSILTSVAKSVPDAAGDVTDADLDTLARCHALVTTGLEQALQLYRRRLELGKS